MARFANCRLTIANTEGRASTLVDSLRASVHDSSKARLTLAIVEGFAGQSAEARRDVEAVIASAQAKGQYLRENEVAGVYALIGDKDRASVENIIRFYAALGKVEATQTGLTATQDAFGAAAGPDDRATLSNALRQGVRSLGSQLARA